MIMIKKLKIGILFSVFTLMAVVGVQNVGAQALTFSSRVNIEIGGKTYIVDAGGGATSVVVGLTSATFTVPAASTVTFISSDQYALDNDGSLTTVCTDVSTYITITGAATVVVTPDTSDQPCSGGGGSSGGGGGGSSKPPATPAIPATVTLPTDCLVGYLFSPSTGKSCSGAVLVTPATPAVPNAQGYAFGTLTVKMGTKGPACTAWQMFLNDKANAGLVTDGWCGKLTIGAAKAWQASKGLVADGLLGPMSRAKALMQ